MKSVESHRPSTESRAVVVAVGAGAVSFVVALIVFRDSPVGLGGDDSVGGVASQLAAVIGLPTFAWTYVRSSRDGAVWRSRARFRRILGVVGLSLTGSIMAALLIGSVFSVFQLAFQDLELDTLTGTALVTGTVACSTAVLYSVATRITSVRLVSMLALFLVAGLFASMLTANDPRWWLSNFSALGMNGETSARTFNLTIILAGLVLGTLADYLTIDLRSRQTARGADLRGVLIVRAALILIGVALIGIGVVPVNVSLLFHNIFAITAIGGFIALLVIVPIVLDGLPPSFTGVTSVFVAAIAAALLLFWPIGYYNLTAVELVAVLVVFAWLIMFVRFTASSDEATMVAIVGRPAAVEPSAPVARDRPNTDPGAQSVPRLDRAERRRAGPGLVGVLVVVAAAVGYVVGQRTLRMNATQPVESAAATMTSRKTKP